MIEIIMIGVTDGMMMMLMSMGWEWLPIFPGSQDKELPACLHLLGTRVVLVSAKLTINILFGVIIIIIIITIRCQ